MSKWVSLRNAGEPLDRWDMLIRLRGKDRISKEDGTNDNEMRYNEVRIYNAAPTPPQP